MAMTNSIGALSSWPTMREQLGLRLVGGLGRLARAPLNRQPVDQPLDLREEILGPKVLRPA